MKTALSIDGGGIRGIIPAIILAEIEQRTGKPIAELFQYLAGTSTGGILTLALTVPAQENSRKPKYTANEIADLYRKYGKDIFSTNFMRKVKNLFGIRRAAKYPTENLENVLKKYFEDVQLSELLCTSIITSYDTLTKKPFYFKNKKAQLDSKRDFFAYEAACATAAPPTIFPPYKLYDTIEDKAIHRSLLDGGLFANNPSQILLNEIESEDKEEVFMLNLGTGNFEKYYTWEEVNRWGIAGWLTPDAPIVDFQMDGTADATIYQMNQKLKENYVRISPALIEPIKMDDAANLGKLEKIAIQTIKDFKKEIDRVVKIIN